MLILIFLLGKNCFAEGQAGMSEFYVALYGLAFVLYTLTGGGLLIIIRQKIGYKNTLWTKVFAFAIALVAAIVFFLIDDFYFLPIFWGS
ncbi:MAG: hypothetical protein AAGH46_04740 [Bacteroidota bacterium]